MENENQNNMIIVVFNHTESEFKRTDVLLFSFLYSEENEGFMLGMEISH